MRILFFVVVATALGVVLGCKHHDVNDAPQLVLLGVAVTPDGGHVEGDIQNLITGHKENFVSANFAIYDPAGLLVGTASTVSGELQPGETWHFVSAIIPIKPMPESAGPATTVEMKSLTGG